MKRIWLILIIFLALFASCKSKNNNTNTNTNTNNNGDNSGSEVNETKTQYEIRFHKTDDDIETVKYDEGSVVDLSLELKKEHYIFLGWSVDKIELIHNLTCDKDYDLYPLFKEIDYILEAYKKLTIPTSTDTNLSFPTKIDDVTITWESESPDYITSDGVITRGEKDKTITVKAIFSDGKKEKTYNFDIKVLKLEDLTILNNVLAGFEFDPTINNRKVYLKSNFSTKYTVISSKWESSDPLVMDNQGNLINYPEEKTIVTFTLTLTLNKDSVTKTFDVTVPVLDFNEKVKLALESCDINTIVTTEHHILPTLFEYDIVGSWTSSDEAIITSDGIVKVTDGCKIVKFTLILTLGEDSMDKEFEFIINNKSHLIINKSYDFANANMINCHLEDGVLVLDDDAVSGTYESNEIPTLAFKSLLPTWNAITSTTATVRFFIKGYVGSAWSDYIYYSKEGWGYGLQNASYDQTNSLVKLSDDEFIVLNNKTATKAKYKLELKRNSLSDASPRVSLVSLALESSEASYNGKSFDELPKDVCYNVPKLYQRAVPTIGGSICSATSTTMLLNYKGLSFKEFDSQYEHRYMAGIVKDYGNNIYGNWVYNCVTLGSFGYYAYCERMYSQLELCNHLAYVGPVAISVKGTMTSNRTSYTTGGHLLVIKGYHYEDGVLTFYANDPNVAEVDCTYSSQIITNTWRNVIYAIE